MIARFVLVALISSVALAVAACGSQAPSPSSAPVASVPAAVTRITLGLYSGRPDPSWILDADEASALDHALGQLPTAVGRPPEGGLGYRGFTIERATGTLVAYRGAIAPPGQLAPEYLSDPALVVERLLLESAGSRLAAAELAEVRRALAIP